MNYLPFSTSRDLVLLNSPGERDDTHYGYQKLRTPRLSQRTREHFPALARYLFQAIDHIAGRRDSAVLGDIRR